MDMFVDSGVSLDNAQGLPTGHYSGITPPGSVEIYGGITCS